MNTFVMAGYIGGWQVVIIVLAILILFGGKKIPELMRGLGKGIGEFKKGMHEGEEGDKDEKKD
ncbi:MAG: twin-arginine translocase TatA/TatE family subunit [Bacteroidales bacterium]